MTDFFDLPEESFSKKPQAGAGKKVDPNVYDPDPNAHNGSYKSVFRFIPYVFDKTKSKYTKYTAKFWNPLTKESLIIDCPSNVEKPSILWTMESVLRSLKKEEPEIVEEIGKNFSRWSTNHSAVYIKKDPQRPDLEGTIKIFKFRNQIGMLIDQLVNPEELDGFSTSKKVNPYHLLEGKDLLCVVGKKTKDFRDWSKCKFMDEVTPLVFKIGDTQVQVKNDEKSVKLVTEFMTKNTPKMDEYFHQEWTEETFNKVAEAIIAAVPQREVLEMILERSKDTKMNELIRSKMKPGKSNAPKASVNDDLEFTSTPTESPFIDEPQTNEPVASTDSDDEYDSLFSNL
jgi:hypothetical protein